MSCAAPLPATALIPLSGAVLGPRPKVIPRATVMRLTDNKWHDLGTVVAEPPPVVSGRVLSADEAAEDLLAFVADNVSEETVSIRELLSLYWERCEAEGRGAVDREPLIAACLRRMDPIAAVLVDATEPMTNDELARATGRLKPWASRRVTLLVNLGLARREQGRSGREKAISIVRELPASAQVLVRPLATAQLLKAA